MNLKLEKEKNRRCFHRLNHQNQIAYSVNNRYYWDRTLNIGAGGVFIKTDAMFEKGDLACMILTPPSEKKYRKFTGRVVHCSHVGIGIQYQDL